MDSRRYARIFLTALAVWLTLAAAQFAMAVGLGNRTIPWLTIALIHAAHAVAWTIITLGLRYIAPMIATRRRFIIVAAHGVALILAAMADAWVRRTLAAALGDPFAIGFWRTVLYYADVTTLSYILAVWLSRVIEAREALIAQTRHELALRSQLARARLGYLHAQLQPHFLFNALGAVSEQIFEDPVAAARTFRQLCSVLRAAASRTASEIQLREEIAGLVPYLEVQRTRFSDWLAITMDIEPGAEEIPVPPLIFQPLIENSIRHGLRDRSSRGEISISARVRGDRLLLSVRDNGVGLDSRHGTRRSGVGLSNTAERLQTLYGDAGTVRLFGDALGGAIAEVSIPVRSDDVAPSPAEVVPPSDASIQVKSGFARRHPAIALVGGCVVAGLLWTQQSYAYLVISGRLGDTSVLDLLRQDFFSVALWAALVPLVLWISRLVPFTARRAAPAVALHLVTVALVAVTHAAAVTLFRGNGSMAAFISMFRGSTVITLLLYLAVVAYSQRRLLEEWFIQQQDAALRLTAGIAEANVAAATMVVSPESLDATLRELERFAAENPLRAELAISRLGNELRSTLDEGSARLRAEEPGSGSGRPVYGEDRVERLAMRA